MLELSALKPRAYWTTLLSRSNTSKVVTFIITFTVPGKGPLKPLSCPADIDFRDKSGFNPRNLDDPCYEITRHVKTSSDVDRKVRDEAKRRADQDKGRYDLLECNCRDYANGLANYAVGANLRERLDGK